MASPRRSPPYHPARRRELRLRIGAHQTLVSYSSREQLRAFQRLLRDSTCPTFAEVWDAYVQADGDSARVLHVLGLTPAAFGEVRRRTLGQVAGILLMPGPAGDECSIELGGPAKMPRPAGFPPNIPSDMFQDCAAILAARLRFLRLNPAYPQADREFFRAPDRTCSYPLDYHDVLAPSCPALARFLKTWGVIPGLADPDIDETFLTLGPGRAGFAPLAGVMQPVVWIHDAEHSLVLLIYPGFPLELVVRWILFFHADVAQPWRKKPGRGMAVPVRSCDERRDPSGLIVDIDPRARQDFLEVELRKILRRYGYPKQEGFWCLHDQHYRSRFPLLYEVTRLRIDPAYFLERVGSLVAGRHVKRDDFHFDGAFAPVFLIQRLIEADPARKQGVAGKARVHVWTVGRALKHGLGLARMQDPRTPIGQRGQREADLHPGKPKKPGEPQSGLTGVPDRTHHECPSCERALADEADACVHCGFPKQSHPLRVGRLVARLGPRPDLNPLPDDVRAILWDLYDQLPHLERFEHHPMLRALLEKS